MTAIYFLSDIIYYWRVDIPSTLYFLKLKECSKDLNIWELLLIIVSVSVKQMKVLVGWKVWEIAKLVNIG